MTRLNLLHLIAFSIFFSTSIFAQPSSTPAAGHEWVLANIANYSNGPFSTQGADGNATVDCGNGTVATICGTNDTSFGWDRQCSNTPSTVVGTPGANFIQAQVFGNIGTTNNLELIAVPCNPGVGSTNPNENWPSTTSETRRINLTNWNNLNPDTAVADGATEGMVWIPTSATLNFRDDGIGDGTGAGADELKFLVIGGNNGQCSSWNIVANYDMTIDAGVYSSIVGTDKKIEETVTQTLSNVPDAGNGNTYHATDNFVHNSGCGNFQGASWYFPDGTNAGAFGTGFSQSFDILSALVEDGSSFAIDFSVNQSISLNRTNGNSDAKVTMGPGMGGKVELIIQYEVWEILAPLPVELSSFTASKKQDAVALNWTTASEINSDYFTAQRSMDGNNWNDIAQIKSAGNSTETQNYSYLDESPNQKNYYRLKQFDQDQTFSYSSIKEVSFADLTKKAILISPNPFRQSFTISNKNKDWDFYEILDQRGRIITRASDEIVNTNTFNQGLHFILFKKSNGHIVNTQKIVKL